MFDTVMLSFVFSAELLRTHATFERAVRIQMNFAQMRACRFVTFVSGGAVAAVVERANERKRKRWFVIHHRCFALFVVLLYR